jgi:predicted dehydrogenase
MLRCTQMSASSSDRPLSLAVVGLSFGRHILDWMKTAPGADRFKLAAVSDLRPNVANEIAVQHGVKAYASLDEVLADKSIEVVGLYTPPSGRAKLLRQILRAGKDVMTTKPFELDAAEAEDVLHEAQRLGRVVHLNSPSPEPSHDLAQMEAWAKEFDLGRLVSARGEVWISYNEKADGSWLDDPQLCPGGAMMRLGIYLINDIVHLIGPVEQINLVSSRVRTGRPTPDNALLTMVGASGCVVSVYASFCIDDGERYANGLSLNYERGSIYRNIGATERGAKPDSAKLSLVMHEGESRRVVAERTFDECSGIYQWENLYRAIVNEESISDNYIHKILEGVKVLEAMRGFSPKAG